MMKRNLLGDPKEVKQVLEALGIKHENKEENIRKAQRISVENKRELNQADLDYIMLKIPQGYDFEEILAQDFPGAIVHILVEKRGAYASQEFPIGSAYFTFLEALDAKYSYDGKGTSSTTDRHGIKTEWRIRWFNTKGDYDIISKTVEDIEGCKGISLPDKILIYVKLGQRLREYEKARKEK